VSRNFTGAMQEKALKDAGVVILYWNEIENARRSLRKGEGLFAHTFRGLGTGRKAIEKALDDIHDKGCHVVDATTGWRSDGPKGPKLMSQAIASLSMERQGGHKGARKNGSAGGIASGKKKAIGRMPWSIIEKHWFNKALDRTDLMEQINGNGYKTISYSAIHKKLGRRGVTLGRRPSEQ
jgi:hypothetical protein